MILLIDVKTEAGPTYTVLQKVLEKYSSILTRFEGGKYLNPRTFVVGQVVDLSPGVRIQYREAKGWRYEATTERRFLLKQPTLSSQEFDRKRGYGAFIIREWKF